MVSELATHSPMVYLVMVFSIFFQVQGTIMCKKLYQSWEHIFYEFECGNKNKKNMYICRCGEHSDYGTFTLLYQDTYPGLEVRIRIQSTFHGFGPKL